jgi:hypothetical protein
MSVLTFAAPRSAEKIGESLLRSLLNMYTAGSGSLHSQEEVRALQSLYFPKHVLHPFLQNLQSIAFSPALIHRLRQQQLKHMQMFLVLFFYNYP